MPLKYRNRSRGLSDVETARRHECRRWGIALFFPALWVLVLWLGFLWGSIDGQEGFYWLGIYPRTLRGFVGILLAPLIHADVAHAFANTMPILILGTLLFRFYSRYAGVVIAAGWLGGGLCVWFFGRSSFHIGASGVIYSMAAYIVTAGILRRQRELVAVSLLVIFLYGSMVWGVLPQGGGRSWESHALGAGVGILAAIICREHQRGDSRGNGIGGDGEYDFSTVTHTGPAAWRVKW